MAKSLPTVAFNESAFKDWPDDAKLWAKQMCDAVNFLLGSYGPTRLGNNLDMDGHQIVNVGQNKVTLG